MTSYVYARVSTDSQDSAYQLSALRSIAPPDSIVVYETASGAKERPELETLVSKLKPGDVLFVSALDRIGRKLIDVLGVLERILKAGAALRSLREGMLYEGPTGRFQAQILASVAELERELIRDRVKAGLARAKSEGRVGGRPKKDAAREDARLLLKQGYSYQEIGKRLGVSPATVCRRLKG